VDLTAAVMYSYIGTDNQRRMNAIFQVISFEALLPFLLILFLWLVSN
jgi:hypothetical protein